MDSRPFFELDIREFREEDIEELKKFSKSAFSLNSILETANTLKYLRAAKRFISDEMHEPNDDFSKLIISKMYEGRITAQVLEQFKPIIKSACKQFLDDKVNERLKNALKTSESIVVSSSVEPLETSMPSEAVVNNKNAVITTNEELEAYMIVKSVVRQVVDLSRVVMRDTKSYCGILLDDNNRKPICRFHFNYSQKYIGFISDKQEERLPIQNLNEIYQYADRLIQSIKNYESSK